MASLKMLALTGLFAFAAADVSEIVGQNQYLPPNKGYNYDRPNVPFPSRPPTPTYQPSSSYQPTSPARPTYQPPTPTYAPPRPSYGPPSVTPTRPPAPRPTPTYPTYQPGASGDQSTIIGGGGDHDHSHDHHEPGMPYDFEYKVKDDYYGTDYSRNEVSDGDVIRGEYRVQLPDGRLQIVKYTADWKNGFNADVSYQGEPTYPTGAASSQYPASGQPSNSYGPPSSGPY